MLQISLLKDQAYVPAAMRSCHTTVTTDGYVLKAVPAKHLAQFLANPPSDAIGLAVPRACSAGSPGMEYQDKFMPYKVMWKPTMMRKFQVYAAAEALSSRCN
jgi:hypothetical protein